jgi:hypothetical protein
LSNGVKSKNGLIKLYKTKIEKLENNDDIKSMVTGCYNSFGEVIGVKNKRIREKGTDVLKYIKIYSLINV